MDLSDLPQCLQLNIKRRVINGILHDRVPETVRNGKITKTKNGFKRMKFQYRGEFLRFEERQSKFIGVYRGSGCCSAGLSMMPSNDIEFHYPIDKYGNTETKLVPALMYFATEHCGRKLDVSKMMSYDLSEGETLEYPVLRILREDYL